MLAILLFCFTMEKIIKAKDVDAIEVFFVGNVEVKTWNKKDIYVRIETKDEYKDGVKIEVKYKKLSIGIKKIEDIEIDLDEKIKQ